MPKRQPGRTPPPANGLASRVRRPVQTRSPLPGRGSETADQRLEPSELSRRQLQIAALVRQGLTNAEIAARLRLTPGAVANHVATILTRLNFRSRAQIAAWAAERGLGGERSDARQL
jgi:DNA-binding NarL/FixJ family response regulator